MRDQRQPWGESGSPRGQALPRHDLLPQRWQETLTNLSVAYKNAIQCWPGGLVGWSIVLYTKRLQVQFPVRPHAAGLIPSQRACGRLPIIVSHINISLSLSLVSLHSSSQINKHFLGVRLKTKNAVDAKASSWSVISNTEQLAAWSKVGDTCSLVKTRFLETTPLLPQNWSVLAPCPHYSSTTYTNI